MAVDDRDSVRDTRTLIGILIRCGAWHIESLAITCMAVDDEVLCDDVMGLQDRCVHSTVLAGLVVAIGVAGACQVRLPVPAVVRAVVARLTLPQRTQPVRVVIDCTSDSSYI